MSSDALLSQGLKLLLLGMGTVFVFLTLLVLVTGLMSSLVLKYFPLPPPARKPAASAGDPALVAVISAAVTAHRRKRGRDNSQSE